MTLSTETLRTGIVARSTPATRAEWDDEVRRVDDLGHDVLLIPDHLGLWPPLSPLVAAAYVSDRLRFGVQVLNNEFWNPALLAREAAAVDVLTGGRLELGFGAGHAQVEFELAGIPYDPPGARIDRLAAAVPRVRRLLAGEGELPTAQERIPFMVGGNGDRVLALAAAEADIVGLTGFISGTGRTHTDLSHFTWAGLADRIDHVRRHAEDRFGDLELSVLVQLVEVTDDRLAAAEAFGQGRLELDTLMDSPFVMLGSPSALAEHLARLQETGVGYVTAFDSSAEALAAARG
jgi:probable F420-dependent oxidoreductase